MEFPQLDRLFDESLQRTDLHGSPTTNAYGNAPLASDHFLLKKSWDYFKSRVKIIEDQCKKILLAKDEQLTTLKAELKASNERAIELEEQNHMLRSLDQTIKKARTEDYKGFSSKNDVLRMHWETEREALQRKIEELEFKMGRAKKDFETRLLSAKTRETELHEEILGVKRTASTQADRERDLQRRWSEQVKEQDDLIQSLENKTEILKNEIDRRDLLIKQLRENINTQEKDAHAMVQYVAELQRSLREKDTELGHAKTRLDILRQEKETMKAAWSREQSEWRELWDRGREAWDRRK